MGPLFALTTLLSGVLLQLTNAKCTFEFATRLVPHYNRYLQPVPHDLGELHSVLSTTECDEVHDDQLLGGGANGPTLCPNPELVELSSRVQTGDFILHPYHQDDPKSWGNYMDALAVWFLSCFNIAVLTVLCLWPGCCCFCCFAHRCSPSERWRTQEKFQTCLLLTFVVLVAALILLCHMGSIGVTRGQLVIVEKPMATLTKMMRSLPGTFGQFVLSTVGRTGVSFLQQGNATFHEYLRPEQLNQSLHCAQDGLEIADQVMNSLTSAADGLKAALASLPEDHQEMSGSLTKAVAAVGANVSGARSVLEALAAARPVLEQELAAATGAGHQMISLIKELESTLAKVRSYSGALAALKEESASFDLTSASQEHKEAHVRRLVVLLKKIPDPQSMSESISSLNTLVGDTSQSLESFLQKWQALKDTISGASGSLKDLPSSEAMAASFESIEQGLAVLGSLQTRPVQEAINKLQEADVASFAEQAERLKANIICTLEAKVCLNGAAQFLGKHPVTKNVHQVETLLDDMQHHLKVLPDFSELSDKLKEVSAQSVVTPDVKRFFDQADALEREVARAKKALDSAPWKEVLAFGRQRETLHESAVSTKAKELKDLLSNPVLRPVKVEVPEGLDLAGLDKALELMLDQRNFDGLPELHKRIESQLPDATVGFRTAATLAMSHLAKVPSVDAEAEQLRQAIKGIPDSKDAIHGLKTLEDTINRLPDPSSYTEGVNKLFSGVAYLQQHTEDLAKTVTGAGKAVKELPHEEFARLTETVERILRFTGSHFSVEGSLAWLVDKWSDKSLEQTMREEGVIELVQKVLESANKSAEFLGLAQEAAIPALQPQIIGFVNALEDRSVHTGKPSENGAVWYILNVWAHIAMHPEETRQWLLPQENFAQLGERALVMGYMEDGDLKPYSSNADLKCWTKECLENTLRRYINKGDLPATLMAGVTLVVPVLLVLWAGLILATRAKCLSCGFLFIALVYLPFLMIIMAVFVPAVIFGADVCGSYGSLSVHTMSILAKPVCESLHGFHFEKGSSSCVFSPEHTEVAVRFNAEEVTRSIVDKCNGRSRPGAEAVHDFWQEAAVFTKAMLNEVNAPRNSTVLGPPVANLYDNFFGNITEDVKEAVLEIGKTADCAALNEIYEDAKDSVCCHIGGNVYQYVAAAYLIGICILYLAIPGGASGMMRKAEQPRRQTQFIGPDGRMYMFDEHNMVEMGRL